MPTETRIWDNSVTSANPRSWLYHWGNYCAAIRNNWPSPANLGQANVSYTLGTNPADKKTPPADARPRCSTCVAQSGA
jgi:hypothetical protein